ncbi:ankyrin repeat domain-containing protein [Candidatus Dependentiae bacterium]
MKRIRSKIFLISLLLFAKTPHQIHAGIPSIKHLYEIFTDNDIGFGQSLLYSNWVKYFYIYGPDDAVRELVRTLWTVLKDRLTGEIIESEDLKYTVKVVPIVELTPELFGEIMALMYKGSFTKEAKESLLTAWLKPIGDVKKKIEITQLINDTGIEKKLKDISDYEEYLELKGKNEPTKKEQKFLKKKSKFAERFKIESAREKLVEIESENPELFKWLGIDASWEAKKKKEELDRKIKILKIGSLKKLKRELKKLEASLNQQEIESVIKVLEAALKKSDKYMPRTVEAILWAFFEHKFEEEEDIKKCLQTIADNVGEDNTIFTGDYKEKVMSDDFYKEYTRDELKKFETAFDKETNQIKYVLANYDLAMSSLVYSVKMSKFPPKVPTGRLPGFDFGICFEAAALDLVSMLWFRPYSTSEKEDNSGYDDSFFPAKGVFFNELEKILKKYDEKGKVDPTNIKKAGVITDWVNIISDNEGMYYSQVVHRKKYEIEPCVHNFIAFLNKFTGLDLKNIGDFKAALSAPNVRTVTLEANMPAKGKFEKTTDLWVVGEKEKVRKKIAFKDIKISVKYTDEDKGVYDFDMVFEDRSDHAALRCAKRDMAKPEIYKNDFIKNLRDRILLENGTNVFNKLTPFLTLLTTPDLLNGKNNLKLLRLIYYSLYLENIKIKNAVFGHMLKSKAYKNKDIQVLTDQLLAKLKNDEEIYRYKICESIIRSGELKAFVKELFAYPLEALVVICRLEKQEYGKALLPLAEKLIAEIKGENINKKIEGDTPLIWAVRKGNLDLVKLLVGHEGIDFDSKDSSGEYDAGMLAQKLERDGMPGQKEIKETIWKKQWSL